MAVNYTSQKCTSCAGTRFEYLKEQKMWKCLYCGALIERQEQIDTMFTIKNVVRQSILDDAWMRLDSAQKNLVECEKIDSRYIGTIIAEITYEVNMLFYGGLDKTQQSNMFAQMKKNYNSLRAAAEVPNDEEIALYDFLDSSEAVGALILVFDALNDSARVELLFNYFDPAEVYSIELNTKLLAYALKQKKFELFDKIIQNSENIDGRKFVHIILKNYPDNENKVENLKKLIGDGEFLNEDDKKQIEKYFQETEDSADTKLGVMESVVKTTACPCVDVMFSSLIAELDSIEKAKGIIDSILEKKLHDTELYKIVEYALMECNGETCLYIFEKLQSSDNFVQLTFDHIYGMLANQGIDAQNKIKISDIAFQFNVSEKILDKCVAAYLSEIYDTPENRSVIIPFLLSKVNTLSLNTVEKYLMNSGVDEENKAENIKLIFSKDINKSIFRNTLNNYLLNTNDVFQVKYDIVCVLQSSGISASLDTCIAFLQKDGYTSDQKTSIVNKLKEVSVDANELYNAYVNKVDARAFDSQIHAALISSAAIATENSLVRYVLWLNDSPAAKVGYVRKLVEICAGKPEDVPCNVMHNGMQISCNLVQGYILASRDEFSAASSILEILGAAKASYDRVIYVNGSKMGFVKYIKSQKKSLSQQIYELCRVCGLL